MHRMISEREHFQRLNKYYEGSRIGYDYALWGSKHFGFHPGGKRVSEKKAQIMMQRLLAKKLRLTSKDVVLDAGCGQGIVSSFLARNYGCSIVGITVVPFEIKKANALAKRFGLIGKVSYQLMDYSKTKFADNSFDCVYTIETLSHALSIEKTIDEFLRILKKSGRATFFEYTIADDANFSESEMRVLEQIMKGSAMDGLKSFRHERPRKNGDRDTFDRLLVRAGFRNVTYENISTYVLPSLKRLRTFAIVPYYLFVKPFGLQERFPNVAAAVECYTLAQKGLIRYNIFTATKP